MWLECNYMAQNGVAQLIDGLTKEFGSFPASADRSPALVKALSDYGSAITSSEGTLDEQAARVIAAEAAVAAEIGKARTAGDACDPEEVRELLGALRIIDDEIAAAAVAGGGIGGVQTGGGVKEFLNELKTAVLKCLGRCGRKIGAAGNHLGDLVIGLFDSAAVARRRAARAAMPAVGDDVLVAEGAVIAGELAVVGVTAGLGGAFDPLYEPLKALLLPMAYGAVVGIPSFVMALGKRLIAMGVVGCAGGAITLLGLLKLALIRRTARGVVSAAGAAAAAVAESPDAILDALNVAAKASAYAVFKKLDGPAYIQALKTATDSLRAALALPDDAAVAAAGEAAVGAGALAAGLLPAEAGAGAGAAAAAAPPADAAAAEGMLEGVLGRAPAATAAAIRKVATAGNIAMNAIKNSAGAAAGVAVNVAKGAQSLVAAGVVGLIKKLVQTQSAAISEVDITGAFAELDAAALAENPEVREAVAAAAAMPVEIPEENRAAVVDAARRVEAAAAGAASKRPRPAEAAEEGDESDEEVPPPAARRRTGRPEAEAGAGAAAAAAPMAEGDAGLEGGHRCPKCGSDMVDRALGVQKPKRKTRKAAPPKKVKKSKKSKTSKKGGSYRKNRKMSEKRRH